MKRLGERINRKREIQNIQLNDLAKRVGISASALSQIEKAKASPSIVTLKNIANHLNTTVGELIGENENAFQNPYVPAEDIELVAKNESGTAMFLLSNHGPNKQMETYLVRFSNHSDFQSLLPSKPGQAFCYILSGVFRFLLDETTYSLKQGDSFYFNTTSNYEIVLDDTSSGELVWVMV